MAIDTNEANLYRTGSGSAFVWGQNKALAGLQQQYQQDQLRKQKEDTEVADQVAKINYDAARNEDLPEILNRYNEIKNTFTKIRGTQSSMDRIKLQADLNQQKSELSRAVNLSKQAASQLGDLGKLRLSHPDDISDDFTPNYKALNNLSVFDPKFATLAEQTSATALLPKFDNNAYSKVILDRSKENIQTPEEKKKDGRMNYTVRNEGSRLNLNNVLDNTISSYKNDRRFQRYLDSQYKGVPHDVAVQQYAKDIYEANKDAYNTVKEKNVRSYMDEPKDRFYEHYQYELKHPKAGAGEKATYYQDLTNKILDGEDFALEALTDEISANNKVKSQNFSKNKVGNENPDLRNNPNGTRTIVFPPVYKETTVKGPKDSSYEIKSEQIQPERVFTWDPKDREKSARTITDIINTYTGQKEPYRKQFTPEGKGKVNTGRGDADLKTNTNKKTIKGF